MGYKKVEQKVKDIAVERYLKGHSLEESVDGFRCSIQTLNRELKRRNLYIRNNSECQRTYNIDSKFFKNIDVEEKAYWLGFILADGSINKNTLQIELSSRDINHLQKFLISIKSNSPVKKRIRYRHNKNIESAYISICCQEFVNDLKTLGIIERKSLIVKFPPNIPKELEHHFWRGVIDGDGCICYITNRAWYINLVGSEDIINKFHSWVKEKINTKVHIRPKGNIYTVGYHGNKKVKSICLNLYKDATIYLDRKMKLAKEIMELNK